MGWLRTAVVGVLLAGVAYGTYVSLNRPPRTEPSEAAVAWAGGSQNLVGAATPQFGDIPGFAPPATTPAAASPPAPTSPSAPPFTAGAQPPVATVAPPAGVPLMTLPHAAPANTAAAGPAGPPASLATPSTSAPPWPGASVASAPPVAAAPSYPTTTPAAAAGVAPPEASLPAISVNPAAATTAPAARQSTASSGTQPVVVYPAQMPSATGLPGAVPTASPYGGMAGGATIPPTASAPPAAVSAPAPTDGPAPRRDEFNDLLAAVEAKLQQGQLGEAHLALSKFYGNPKLTPEEDRRLTDLLDQVAGTVIYSRQHLLEPPHVVKPGETLDSIGQQYNVPGELLGKINGIGEPAQLRPGMELKVVRGPFDALVDLDRFEMTLIIQGRYAGRFPISLGTEQPQLEGEFAVRDKRAIPAYPAAPTGRAIHRVLDLGNQVTIHAAEDPQNLGRTGGRGCIGMSVRDISDVYDILSVGSRVTIRR